MEKALLSQVFKRSKPLKKREDSGKSNIPLMRCIRCPRALHHKGCLMPSISKKFQGIWGICDISLPHHEPLSSTDRDEEDCELDADIPPIKVFGKGGAFQSEVMWFAPKRDDFRLPKSCIKQFDLLMSKEFPAPFKKISANWYNEQFVQRPSSLGAAEPCVCNQYGDNCEDNCLNRAMYVECNSKCPNGPECQNQRLRRHEFAKTKVAKTSSKGFGLQLCQGVKEGDLVIEYCGEVISPEECARRLEENASQGRSDFYMFKISNDYVLDAGPMGSNARFINHSCDPNCRTQLWTVGPHKRVGIYALRDLKAGTELTYDYCCQGYWCVSFHYMEYFSRLTNLRFDQCILTNICLKFLLLLLLFRPKGQEQRCNCGAKNCRLFLGAKPLKNGSTHSSPSSSKSKKRKPEKRKLKKKDVDVTETESEVDVSTSAGNTNSVSVDDRTETEDEDKDQSTQFATNASATKESEDDLPLQNLKDRDLQNEVSHKGAPPDCAGFVNDSVLLMKPLNGADANDPNRMQKE